MGRAARSRPLRLAEKLLQIREMLGLSQNELLERLGVAEQIGRNHISMYERDEREPPLLILLRYAELVNVCTDTLIDDSLDLPSEVPSRRKH